MGAGNDAVLLPSEHVLLVRAELGSIPPRQRTAAARRKIKELIAEPDDRVHVVLGPELEPGIWLVAIVGHAVMAAWAARTDSMRPRLVPDVLALPVPPEGSICVMEREGRVLVRLADGTGYATGLAAFPTFWRLGGRPEIVLLGGRLPPDIPIGHTRPLPTTPPREALFFDLGTDRHAQKGRDPRRPLRRLAAVAALALAAHGAILGAETLALRGIAARQEALLHDELSQMAGPPPLAVLHGEVAPDVADVPQPAGGGLLPLLEDVSRALLSSEDEIMLRRLAFEATAGSLEIVAEGPDLTTLQRMEDALRAAGLAVATGAATGGTGLAEAHYVVRRGADAP